MKIKLITSVKHLFIVFILCLELTPVHGAATAVPGVGLRGYVREKSSGKALPGATIYIADLKRGAISQQNGEYHIDNVPATRINVRVTLLGYSVAIETIDLNTTSAHDFLLDEAIIETNEVVVTGVSQATEKKRLPTPIVTISDADLHQSAATNIIEAVAQQPGLSTVSTGAAIAKPVIRGLGYNRVVVVNDGVRQEGQQWGDEHGIEVDGYDVNSVEILKGPASLTYGSDAMAGVVNLLAARTVPEGKIMATVDARYATNNAQQTISFNSAAHLGGWVWDVRTTLNRAHSYQNAYDGYVANSGFDEKAAKVIVGLNASWGYSHLHLSTYGIEPGIVEGARDNSGHFTKQIRVNDSTTSSVPVTNDDFLSLTSQVPFQKIRHTKIVWENNLFFAESNLKVILGWQQNSRQEFSDVLQPTTPGLSLRLQTFNYDLAYTLSKNQSFECNLGVNGMWQESINQGNEFLIPDYRLFDIGTYIVMKKSIGAWDIAGGARIDSRNESADALYLDAEGKPIRLTGIPVTTQFTGFKSDFEGVSGSLGCTYQFSDELFCKLNISRGYRAPNINELAANGVHDGTTRFEIGSSTLRSENSMQFDVGVGYHIDHLSIDLSTFRNSINNYIFTRKITTVDGRDSLRDGYQTFVYSSGNALLYGAEIIVDLHPHPFDWLHFENSFAIVHSSLLDQPDSMSSLPLTPPAVFRSNLKAHVGDLFTDVHNAYATVGVEYSLKQDRIYSAFGTETVTPGYVLVNAGLGCDVQWSQNVRMTLSLTASNLLDAAYQNHLSRLKYTDVNTATGRVGVYNMGRSFALKCSIPIELL